MLNRSGLAILGNYFLIVGAAIVILCCNNSFADEQENYSLPVPGYNLLSAVFNTPRPSYINPGSITLHKAIDIVCPRYATVNAICAGDIYKADFDDTLGNYVIIKTANGDSIIVGHMQRLRVWPGDKVNAGQMIGQAGDTGRARGVHVHLQVKDKYGTPVKVTFRFGIKWRLLGNVYTYQSGQ